MNYLEIVNFILEHNDDINKIEPFDVIIMEMKYIERYLYSCTAGTMSIDGFNYFVINKPVWEMKLFKVTQEASLLHEIGHFMEDYDEFGEETVEGELFAHTWAIDYASKHGLNEVLIELMNYVDIWIHRPKLDMDMHKQAAKQILSVPKYETMYNEAMYEVMNK